VCKTALVSFRSDDPDIIGELACDTLQNCEAFSVDTIIVRQQNSHVVSPSFTSLMF
jgi:aspartate carbamoyltransferase catalytic subunit